MKTRIVTMLTLLGMCVCAHAQRAGDNAVRDAEDAFGSSIGNESIGLYDSWAVRGFSPRQAGNIRLEGLYFDEAAWLSPRAVEGSRVRVGLTASGYAFPAPTGIIDYTLRKPEATRVVSVVGGAYEWGGKGVEVDAKLPLDGRRLGLAAGASVVDAAFADGSKSKQRRLYALLGWRPSESVDVMPFASFTSKSDEPGPFIIALPDALPPAWPQSRLLAPNGAQIDAIYLNNGVLGRAELGAHWRLAVLGVDSRSSSRNSVSDLYLQTGPATMQEILYASRGGGERSRSGEVRLTWHRAQASWLHQVHLSVRGRVRENRYGGEAEVVLPERAWGTPAPSGWVMPATGEHTRDAIRQTSVGLAWEGRWKDHGEFNLGVMKTQYRKSVQFPGLAADVSRAQPVLGYGSVVARLRETLALYAGHTRGLEESGTAPENARNRKQPLPAILTRQTDAGLRWKPGQGWTIAAGWFDVSKPYFSLRADNTYGVVGTVRHRGVEASASGDIGSNTTLVLGGLWLDACARDASGDRGGCRRPVGSTPLTLRAYTEYRLARVPGLAFDLSMAHGAATVADEAQAVRVPAVTTFDLGLRYGLKLGNTQGSIRASVSNVGDTRGWEVVGSSAFTPRAGRTGSLLLSLDI